MMAVDVRIEALQKACRDLTDYMTIANERFSQLLAKDPEMETRWTVFYERNHKRTEFPLTQLKDLVSRIGSNQMIEAEVRVR